MHNINNASNFLFSLSHRKTARLSPIMYRWLARVFRLKRTRRAAITILAFASVILLVRLELYAIQAIPAETGDIVIEASSFYVQAQAIYTVRLEEHLNTTRRTGDERVTERPSHSDGEFVSIQASSVSTVSTASANKRETPGVQKLSCAEQQADKPSFREIDKETLIYSVWFDDRKSQHFIRILLLTSKINALPSLSCHFESATKQDYFTSEVTFYKHNENHNRRFGGYIASCIVPQELDRIPCVVNILTSSTEKQSNSNSVAFPVSFIDRQPGIVETSGAKYGVCIPPVHGEISAERLIEFLELTQILGASYFTFYDLRMTESVRNVLNHYQKEGLVSVLEWNLPSYIGKNDVHYFGQVLSIMDCLYRSMKHLHFVAFHDLDEFIVPLRHDNISAMMKEIHKEDHCGHCFQSVLFDPSRNHSEASPLQTQCIVERTSQATPLWTKCIVDPRRIFEQGIHHISKQNEEYYHPDKVDWNIARVFHYRKCQDSRASIQPKCSEFEVDKTMLKFGQQLKHNFQIVINATNERKP